MKYERKLSNTRKEKKMSKGYIIFEYDKLKSAIVEPLDSEMEIKVTMAGKGKSKEITINPSRCWIATDIEEANYCSMTDDQFEKLMRGI